VSDARLTYRFGPLERRGLFGAIHVGQAAAVGLGTAMAIVALDAAPSASGLALAGVLVAASVAFAAVPAGGRTLAEWMPLVAVFLARRSSRRARFRSHAPARGTMQRGSVRAQPVAVPTPALDGAAIVALPYRDRMVGVLSDRRRRRLTLTLACRAGSFSLLDPDAQERRLARWGMVLSAAAGTSVRRIQWTERTSPAQGDALARWLHDERDPAVPLRGTAMIESYLELIGSSTRVTQEHEILVSVQLDTRRGRDQPHKVLLAETERVAQGLHAAEVSVKGALSPGQLATALRIAHDPFARAELTALDAADAARDGLAEASAWPLSAEERWDHYRCDGAWHTTYWIAGWPRVEVSPMFMDAMLTRSSAVRAVAVVFEPIPPGRSTREVEAAITRDRADGELRRRFGQSETARQRQAQEATRRREAELAAGHAEVRFSGFVTVSGRDHDELRSACAEVLDHAARARLELRCLYGQQAEAFTFTLPVCRGLR